MFSGRHCGLCKNQSWTVVKVVKTDFHHKLLQLGKRDLNTELGSVPNTTRKVGISSQGGGRRDQWMEITKRRPQG